MSRKYVNAFLKALKIEYTFFPSLGLVSKVNSGSHQDMDYYTFVKSARVFKPYLNSISKNYSNINNFNDLKQLGYEFEKLMFQTTNNVNTHKGLIFCGGIFFYCYLKSRKTKTPLYSCLRDFCSELHKSPRPNSPSQQLVQANNLWHAIDYAIDGYQIVFSGFDFWKSLSNLPLPLNLKYFTLLLFLVINLDDTTLITKIGYQAWQSLIPKCQSFLTNILNGTVSKTEIIDFNTQAIANNISPGGCADIFVLIMFLVNVNYS